MSNKKKISMVVYTLCAIVWIFNCIISVVNMEIYVTTQISSLVLTTVAFVIISYEHVKEYLFLKKNAGSEDVEMEDGNDRSRPNTQEK